MNFFKEKKVLISLIVLISLLVTLIFTFISLNVKINTVTTDIETNTKAIKANATAITDATTAITTNATAITDASATIKANTKAIDNANIAITANATNTNNLIKMVEDVTTMATDAIKIAESASKIAKENSNAITNLKSRIDDIAAQNREIEIKTGLLADVNDSCGLVPIRIGPFNPTGKVNNPNILITLTQGMKTKLDEVAVLVNAGKTKLSSIRGYADARGLSKKTKKRFKDNNALATARAQVSLDYLNTKLTSKAPPSTVVSFSAKRDRFGGEKENNRCVVVVLKKTTTQ